MFYCPSLGKEEKVVAVEANPTGPKITIQDYIKLKRFTDVLRLNFDVPSKKKEIGFGLPNDKERKSYTVNNMIYLREQNMNKNFV
ncbi:MAG TPA: hypothetical protein VLE21_00110 [Candidatus Nitrosocosmicus sp.]|nr:hypothetical protein [Candidatus Nitrosocosmicus sp.]